MPTHAIPSIGLSISLPIEWGGSYEEEAARIERARQRRVRMAKIDEELAQLRRDTDVL